jgi:hypothetical protein
MRVGVTVKFTNMMAAMLTAHAAPSVPVAGGSGRVEGGEGEGG